MHSNLRRRGLSALSVAETTNLPTKITSKQSRDCSSPTSKANVCVSKLKISITNQNLHNAGNIYENGNNSNTATMSEILSTTTTTTTTTAAATSPNSNHNTSKRSLSESSADEFHKSTVAPSVDNIVIGGSNRKNKMWRNELSMNLQSKRAQPQQQIRKHSSASVVGGGVGGRSTEWSTYGGGRHVISDVIDVAVRVVMVIIFTKLETSPTFKRKIQIEELWLYKNPRTADIVTPAALLLTVILGPFFTTLFFLLLTRDRRDFRAASWTWTLALCFNGLATSTLKITVGRPRPDFFYRCFPDGVMVLNNVSDATAGGAFDLFNCSGSLHDVNEGRKSFPSGHASFAFTGLGFIAFYIGAKLQAFSSSGRGQTWRLIIALAPLVVAALVAISRTCDYHHHWQDVLVGSLIGFFITYFVYRQYYPSLFARNCHRAYPRGRHSLTHGVNCAYERLPSTGGEGGDPDTACDETLESESGDDDFDAAAATSAKDERRPLICDVKSSNKWI